MGTLPMPGPAANERSPNRRSKWKLRARGRIKARKKRTFLELVSLGEVPEEAAGQIGLSILAVQKWTFSDSAFKAGWQQALEEARRVAAGQIDGALPRAARTLVGIMDHAGKDPKLQAEVAHRLLKGRGVLVGEGVRVAVGVQVDNQPPKYIEIAQAHVNREE